MRELKAGRYDRVDDELVRWVNVNGRRNAVLVKRRRAEAALFQLGLEQLDDARVVTAPVDVGVDEGRAEYSPEVIDPFATGTGRTALRVGGAGILATAMSALADLALDERAFWVMILAAVAIVAFVAWVVITRARR
jgi:hypothetical protein